jgi:hypothetical protein
MSTPSERRFHAAPTIITKFTCNFPLSCYFDQAFMHNLKQQGASIWITLAHVYTTTTMIFSQYLASSFTVAN